MGTNILLILRSQLIVEANFGFMLNKNTWSLAKKFISF